jgi:hypothetical protein
LFNRQEDKIYSYLKGERADPRLAAGAVGDTGGRRFLPDAAGAALIGFDLDPAQMRCFRSEGPRMIATWDWDGGTDSGSRSDGGAAAGAAESPVLASLRLTSGSTRCSSSVTVASLQDGSMGQYQ